MTKSTTTFCATVAIAFWGATVAPVFAMDLSNFQSTLARLQQEQVSKPGSPAARELLRDLDRKHNPSEWINEVPSQDMASPSPERLNRIQQIADAIAPYEQALVSLAFDNSIGSDADRAIDFLWYAKPTPTLRRSLIAASDEHPIAFQLLFETGMFDGEVRARYAAGLAPSASVELREQRASMATEWGLPEAVPVFAEMLRKPFDPAKVSFVGHIPAEDAGSSLSSYGVAAQAAMYLGPAGTALLPLIKQRFSEIQRAFPDRYQPLTGNLTAAVEILEGRRSRPIHAARSGRGAINLGVSSLPIAHVAGSATSEETSPPAPPLPSRTPFATPAASPQPATPAAQTPAPTVEQSAPVWPWLVGIVALVVIVAVALKRRA